MYVYIISLIIFSVLFYLVPRKYLGYLYLALTLDFAIMAFNCKPGQYDDLTGYFEQLNMLREGGWSFFRTAMNNNLFNWGSLPTCGYYYFLISRLPDNGYLPGITLFLSYGSIFLTYLFAARRFKIKKWYLYLGTMFMLSVFYYYDICSGIRNGLGFSLFISIVYFDLVEKKNKYLCWLAYFILTGLHSSVIVFLFLRIAVALSGKSKNRIMDIGILFSMIGSGFCFDLLSNTNISYFQTVSQKGKHNYNKVGYFETSTGTIISYPQFLICGLVSLYCSSLINNSEKTKEVFAEYDKFYRYMMLFALGSATSQLLFIRIVHWVIPAMCGLYFMIGLQINSDKTNEEFNNIKENSIIRNKSAVTTNELLFNLFVIAYTSACFWFTCNATNLMWLKFR